ncbi:tetratricopeptide repeat protein [bacterium]|nr:tetratricopeptide repeat protein [bacterium]
MTNSVHRPPKNTTRIIFAIALLVIPALLLWIYFAPQPGGEPSFESLQRKQSRQEQKPPIEQMLEMWKTAPGHGPIALELGNMYFMAGQYEKAIEFYREFLKTDTTEDGWLVRLDISRSLAALGRDNEAITELKDILKDHPGDPGALYNLGAIEANRGNHDVARDAWSELIRLHPSDTLATYAQKALPRLKPSNHP